MILGPGVVDVAGGDDRQPALGGQPCQDVVVGGIQRHSVIGELHGHRLAAEQTRQVVQGPAGRLGTAGGQRPADGALAAAGEDRPMPPGVRGEPLRVIARAALLGAFQLGLGDRRGQPVIALLAAGQHQQMDAGRVGPAVLRSRQIQREFRAEDGLHRRGLGRLGEPDHPVEPVVIGERHGVQAEPLRLLDQCRRPGGAVEEGIRGVRVQLRIGHRVLRALDRRRRVGLALPRERGVVPDHLTTAQRSLQLAPGDCRVVEPHSAFPSICQSLVELVETPCQRRIPRSRQARPAVIGRVSTSSTDECPSRISPRPTRSPAPAPAARRSGRRPPPGSDVPAGRGRRPSPVR